MINLEKQRIMVESATKYKLLPPPDNEQLKFFASFKPISLFSSPKQSKIQYPDFNCQSFTNQT